MSIHSVEDKSRKELVDIVKIQQEYGIEREKELKKLQEKLAKANEDYKAIFSAFESYQDELKKANERVAELEKSNKSCAVAISCLIAKGEVGPLLITGDELDEIVNKFAIEKKIEMLREAREPFYQKKADLALIYGIGGSECKKIAAWFDSKIEQLRKEQEG